MSEQSREWPCHQGDPARPMGPLDASDVFRCTVEELFEMFPDGPPDAPMPPVLP